MRIAHTRTNPLKVEVDLWPHSLWHGSSSLYTKGKTGGGLPGNRLRVTTALGEGRTMGEGYLQRLWQVSVSSKQANCSAEKDTETQESSIVKL